MGRVHEQVHRCRDRVRRCRSAREIERHTRARAVGARPVDGIVHRVTRATAGRPALPPQGPTEGDGLYEAVVEGRREAHHAPSAADEIEARDVTGEQSGVAPVPLQAQPGPQEQPGDRRGEPGQEHEGVAQGTVVDEDDPGVLVHGAQRLRPQPGNAARLEEPSFHGEAG